MDRLEAIAILVEAVEAGSLSEASRRLGIPLATISRKVSDLEAHLNTILLTRSSKGLVPTPAGQSFIAASKTILEQIHEAERAAAGEYVAPKGDLVVSAPTVFGRLHVLPVVSDFLSAYPEVGVSLVLSDRSVNLVSDQVDVAIRFGDLPDSGLTATRLGTVRRVICASPAYLGEHGHPAEPADLIRYSAISFEGLAAPGLWRFERNGDPMTAPVKARISVNTAEGAIDAAIQGLGLTRALSYQVVDHVRQDRLEITLAVFERQPWPVHILYNGQSRLPLKMRAFIDFAAPRLRERLKEAGI